MSLARLGSRSGKHGLAEVRAFCTISEPTLLPPLSEGIPGLPELVPGRALPTPVTEVTTLDNGFRIASEETYGQVSVVGLFVDFGSAYEDPGDEGVAHFLQNLAFHSTHTRSAEHIQNDLQKAGLAVESVFNREVGYYKVEGLRSSVDESVRLLAETTQQPLFLDQELQHARLTAQVQYMDLLSNPQLLSQEHLYLAAYGANSPLGKPFYCPPDVLDRVTADKLRKYLASYFIPQKMVLAGAGVEHERLVELGERFFGNLPAEPPAGFAPKEEIDDKIHPLPRSPRAETRAASKKRVQDAKRHHICSC